MVILKSIEVFLSIAVHIFYEMQQPEIFIAKGLMCTRKCRKTGQCSQILQVDGNLLIGHDIGIFSLVKIYLFTWFQMKIQEGRNILLGLSFVKSTRIGKVCYITNIDEHLVKCMMQNSKKGLLPFGFGVVFLKTNVLRHQRREIALR